MWASFTFSASFPVFVAATFAGMVVGGVTGYKACNFFAKDMSTKINSTREFRLIGKIGLLTQKILEKDPPDIMQLATAQGFFTDVLKKHRPGKGKVLVKQL